MLELTHEITARPTPEELLHELVDIDSPTTDVSGVNRVQLLIARELAAMGLQTHFHPNPSNEVASGDLLVAEIKGERPEFVTLVSHADTVLSVLATGPFRTEGQRAFGSGVIDNKGGLVVAIEGLRKYLESCSGRPAFSIRFVSSPNEEGGSLGFHEHFRKCAEDSAVVLGFEPALENGSIVESRRGNRWYEIDIEGQEAHAGRCRGEQINAAHELAEKIVRFSQLNDPSGGISVNVAQIYGGRDRFNIVCGEAGAKLDVRFTSFESRERVHDAITDILAASYVSSAVTGRASTARSKIVDDCPPFSNTLASKPVIDFILREIHSVEGRTVGAEKAGGAGDVNYMSRENVIVIDGLGPYGGLMHTVGEFIHLPSLQTRAYAFARLLAELPGLV